MLLTSANISKIHLNVKFERQATKPMKGSPIKSRVKSALGLYYKTALIFVSANNDLCRKGEWHSPILFNHKRAYSIRPYDGIAVAETIIKAYKCRDIYS